MREGEREGAGREQGGEGDTGRENEGVEKEWDRRERERERMRERKKEKKRKRGALVRNRIS